MRLPDHVLAYAKVAVQLISAFVFASLIVQCIIFLNPKLQASNHLMGLYSPEFVRHVGKVLSHDMAHIIVSLKFIIHSIVKLSIINDKTDYII